VQEHQSAVLKHIKVEYLRRKVMDYASCVFFMYSWSKCDLKGRGISGVLYISRKVMLKLTTKAKEKDTLHFRLSLARTRVHDCMEQEVERRREPKLRAY